MTACMTAPAGRRPRRASPPSAALCDITNTMLAKRNDLEQKHYVF
jgi:hypothetical protein